MKATDVKTGQVYKIKVGKSQSTVKITGVNPKGGWEAVNTKTGKAVNIKSHSRIIAEAQTSCVSKPDGDKETRANKTANSGNKTAVSKPGQREGKLSGLDAAAKVLSSSKEPLNTSQITEIMFKEKLWHSEGATPAATIYSAIIREIKEKGPNSRFKKTGRGKFTFNS